MAMDPTSSSGADPAAANAGAGAQQNVPKFRQNIIIVKNINVLTKLQQPPKGGSSTPSAPQPQPTAAATEESSAASEESSEESSQSQ
jgi:hypothetical protein